MDRTFEDNTMCGFRTEDPNEMCKNCKHLRRLWWWKCYPEGKQYGWCCDLFNNKPDGYILMQLYSIYGLCEMFCPVNGWDKNKKVMPGGLFDDEEK